MKRKEKIVLSLLVAAMLCAAGAVYLVVGAVGAPADDGAAPGIKAGIAQGTLVESLGTLSFPEDEYYKVVTDELFFDGWEYISADGNSFVDVRYDDDYVYFYPDENWFGIETVDVTAYYNFSIGPPPIEDEQLLSSVEVGTDGGLEVTYNVIIDVLPVNDPPILTETIPDLIAQSGGTIYEYAALDDYFMDVDNDVSYFCSVEMGYVAAYVDGGVIGFEIGTAAEGSGQITVYATDGEYAACDVIEAEIGRSSSVSFDEDTSHIQLIGDLFPDNPVSIKCIESGSLDVGVSEGAADEWVASFDSPLNWNGAGRATFEALMFRSLGPRPSQDECTESSDDAISSLPGYWYTAYITLDADVLPVNDPPRAIPQLFAPLSMDEDIPLFNIMDVSNLFYDVDSELQYTTSSKTGLTAPSLDFGEMLSAVPAANAYGNDTIEVCAYDGEFSAVTDIPVAVNSVNDDPYAEYDGLLVETPEDVPMTIDIAALFGDIDGPLTYSFANSTNCSVVLDQANGTATITPADNWNGVEQLTVTADDGMATTSVAVYAIVSSVNDPVFVASDAPSLSFEEDGSARARVSSIFGDVDSDISLSASTDCGGLTVGLLNGYITVTGADNWNGDGSVELTATDGQYTATATIDVAVASVNDLPAETLVIGDISVLEDSSAAIDLNGHFADSDGTLAYTVAGPTQIVASVGQNGVMTISAPANWYGPETLTICATDGEASASETITVTFEPVNDAPIVAERMAAASFVAEGRWSIDLSGSFSDPDGDHLSYAVTVPKGLTAYIDVENQVAVLSSAANYSGACTITVTATDGVDAVSSEMDVVVSQKASTAQAGLPIEAGYVLGGGMIAMCAFAAVSLSMYAREARLNSPAGRRAKSAVTA